MIDGANTDSSCCRLPSHSL